MDVLMPQLGETVAEGKIVKWFKQAGDAVTPGDNLFEIETDKTSMEVPAIAAGTLTDIRFAVGETAKVGAVVAVIAGAGGETQPKPAAAKPAEAPKAVEPTKAVEAPKAPKPVFVSPRAAAQPATSRQNDRDFAYTDMTLWREVRTPERNYGPAKLSSGTYVTPLARRLASERGIDLNRVSGSGPHGRIVAADIASASTATSAGMGVAQFTLVADVDVGRVIAMLNEAKAGGAEFALGDFVIKAWAAALKRVTPDAGTDIGLIQNIDGQRVTTTVSDAASKSLTMVAKEARETSSAAATTAVHVLSRAGIREVTAVVTPPFTSVLAAGEPRRAPVEAEDGGVRFISQMTVTLSCDPRAVDSATAEELLAAFKTMIENPVAALV